MRYVCVNFFQPKLYRISLNENKDVLWFPKEYSSFFGILYQLLFDRSRTNITLTNNSRMK